MRQFSILTMVFLLFLFLVRGVPAQAQISSPRDNHSESEEQEGQQLLDNLNNKTATCSELKDADFEKIGEYFMGQSIGDTSRHIAMNEMMKSMMGEQGEAQMHIAWGKRGSGCDTSTAFPSQGAGFMPMVWMMGGGGNPMMGGWNGFGILGWLPMLLFWILLILGVVALFRYLGGSTRSSNKERSPLDILKERYAKGELDKKEFEQMKKDLA